MKKLLALALVLFPICVSAQIFGTKHHVEVGAGVAMPGEFLFELPMKSGISYAVYGEYRYEITPALSVGAVYSFVFPHESVTVQNEPALVYKDCFHTLNAITEYRFGQTDAMNMYIGGGVGVQYYPGDWVPQMYGYGPYNYFAPDVSLHLAVEVFKHLRITIGHYHDLSFHFYPGLQVASYYHASLGWSF